VDENKQAAKTSKPMQERSVRKDDDKKRDFSKHVKQGRFESKHGQTSSKPAKRNSTTRTGTLSLKK
ncbi:hypothetical protein ACJBT7_10325, partial [Streptococcus suis]